MMTLRTNTLILRGGAWRSDLLRRHLMGGLIGRLFHEFAMTVSVAVVISAFVSPSPTISPDLVKIEGSCRFTLSSRRSEA